MEIKVTIEHLGGGLRFRAKNAAGLTALIDGGSSPEGMRPMEFLLSALGSCTAFDALLILEKQRQKVEKFEVEIRGTRPDNLPVKPFTAIELVFHLSGDLDRAKVERAFSLSLEKYCSVKASLDPNISIAHRVELSA